MLVSLSTASLYVYPLRRTFSLAKRSGFDGVELVIGPEVEWRGPEYVRQLSREFSLPVLSVHPPLFGFPGWRRVQTSIAPYLGKAVEITRRVDAPILVLHMPHAPTLDEGIGQRFVAGITGSSRQLNGSGPRFAVENGPLVRPRDAEYVLRRLPDLRAFADEHNFPMTLDTAHVGTWGLDLLDALDYFEDRLVNVHFSDLREVSFIVRRRPFLHSYLTQHQLPGAGHLPLGDFVRALNERRYAGPITFELSPLSLQLWSPRKVEENLRACVEFVRS